MWHFIESFSLPNQLVDIYFPHPRECAAVAGGRNLLNSESMGCCERQVLRNTLPETNVCMRAGAENRVWRLIWRRIGYSHTRPRSMRRQLSTLTGIVSRGKT